MDTGPDRMLMDTPPRADFDMAFIPDTSAMKRPVAQLGTLWGFSAILCAALLPGCGEESPPTSGTAGTQAPPETQPEAPANGAASAPSRAPETQRPAADGDARSRLPVRADRVVRHEVAEEIGAQVVWCTPAAADDDAAARDTAAAVLSHLGVLSDAVDDTITWGVLAAGEVARANEPRGMVLDPAVWAGCYLSCFVFSGPVTITALTDGVMLTVPARFRSGLPAGDYPHALWHPGDEWSSYARTVAVEFIFIDDHLIASFRREGATAPSSPAPRVWDGDWRWREGAYLRPRTADFASLFSEDNPHVAGLDRAYRELLPVFEAGNCLACHMPGNPGGARSLLVLGMPNHALAARAPLAAVLIGESDGPAEATRCTVAALTRSPSAESVAAAAVRFLEEGDGATEYEWIRLIRPDEQAERISP